MPGLCFLVNTYTISTCTSAACACTQCWTTATMVTVPAHLCSHTPYESSGSLCRGIWQWGTPGLSTASEQCMSAVRHSLAATPRHHCTAATGQCASARSMEPLAQSTLVAAPLHSAVRARRVQVQRTVVQACVTHRWCCRPASEPGTESLCFTQPLLNPFHYPWPRSTPLQPPTGCSLRLARNTLLPPIR